MTRSGGIVGRGGGRGRRTLRRAYNVVPSVTDDDDDDDSNSILDTEEVEEVEVFVDEEDQQQQQQDTATTTTATVTTPPTTTTSGRHRRRQYQTIRTDDDDGNDEDDVVVDDDGTDLELLEEGTTYNVNNIPINNNIDQENKKVCIVRILDPAQKTFYVVATKNWTILEFKVAGEKIHKVPPSSQRLIFRGRLLQDSQKLQDVIVGLEEIDNSNEEIDNIIKNNKNNKHIPIIHLFPKPRVIIQSKKTTQQDKKAKTTTTTSTTSGDTTDDDDDDSSSSNNNNDDVGGGAHIPQIILDADEAEQRSTILVLGSADFLEAQNNVKLFSFLLLVISSIELFNLILILLGVPPDGTNGHNTNNGNNSPTYGATSNEDDIFHFPRINTTTNEPEEDLYNNNPYAHADPYEQEQIQEEMSTWHPRNNVDFIISAVGVYVALLGIRATNETTLRLARQYLYGTIIVGVSWMMYNYWFTVHVDEEFDQLRRDERHNHTIAPSSSGNDGNGNHTGNSTSADDDDDRTSNTIYYDDDVIPHKSDWQYYQQNLSLMMIPAMVWILCCVRAWQFQSLLEEAEQEAEERIRNELSQHQQGQGGNLTIGGGGGENNTAEMGAASSNHNSDGDDEETGGRDPTSVVNNSTGGRGRGQRHEMDLTLQNNSAVLT